MDPYEFNDMVKKLREGERVTCPICKAVCWSLWVHVRQRIALYAITARNLNIN